MVMSYTTLTAAKGNAGSIANWVGYSKLDIATVLDEAQSIIFQSLRVREMRTEYVFNRQVGQSRFALPARFLDPIGRIRDNVGNYYRHLDESAVLNRRSYQAISGGTLPDNPFTTTGANSSLVNANVPNHGLTQNSDITFGPTTPTVDGIGMNTTFNVLFVIDSNNIQLTSQNGDQAILGGQTGGGSGVTWTANKLIQSVPSCWAIFDEAIQFDAAFDTATTCRLLYFRSPPLLSATNATNFLTSRYPRLIREATNAAAASFMKDDNEEQKALQKLAALIDATNAESDLIYRGSEIIAETPGTTGEAY